MEHTEENIKKEPLENTSDLDTVGKENPVVEKNEPVKSIVSNRGESEYYEFTPVENVEAEDIDYSTLNKEQIVVEINGLLNSSKIIENKDKIEELKICFYKIHRAEVEEKRQSFIADGGLEEDFLYEDNLETQFKAIYKKYKEQRNALNESIEKEKQDNLSKRLALIEELKGLINNNESVDKTFNEFREIQQKWRTIGMVPQQDTKNIWENYHHYVGKFYDFVKINKELRDLDLKKNLELKTELCEKAERLLLEESVVKAFAELQKLHEQWREIGPVVAEKKNELWERFKSVTTQVNKKHQDFFINIKELEKSNLNAKIAICEKVESIVIGEIASAKQWQDLSAEIAELQKLWKTIGFAPKKSNTEIYQRFRKSCDDFFESKRRFFEKIKGEEDHNKQLRIDLCLQAESLQTNTDWKKTTSEFIALQNDWKKLAPISRKDSEKLWKRFRTACDMFFEAKEKFYKTIESDQEENLKKKLQLIEKVENLTVSDDTEDNLLLLQELQKEWSEIGFIPLNQKEKIQNRFRDAIGKKLEGLSIEDEKKKYLKYKVKMENVSGNKNVDNKISFERTKIHKKIKEITEEIGLLENNIGFFSKSKNAESIVGEQLKKIEKLKHDLDLLHKQNKVLDEIERGEPKQ